MRRIYFILILFVSLSNCDKKQKLIQGIISLEEASIIEKSLSKTPPSSIESFNIIYVVDEDGFLHITDYSYLKSLYDLGYSVKYKSFSFFIYNIVNQKTKLKRVDFNSKSSKCKIDQNIFNVYKMDNIEGLVNKYCIYDKEKNRFLFRKEGLSYCELETISYYFFLNKYKKVLNDYS
ncbi:hypothetical protein BWK60_06175, partial [Flavobacterium covae]|uniref:hypothetical protein n=1 Tax=Flavobacterium covae TaxID=2906076 RepID=UPI000B626299